MHWNPRNGLPSEVVSSTKKGTSLKQCMRSGVGCLLLVGFCATWEILTRSSCSPGLGRMIACSTSFPSWQTNAKQVAGAMVPGFVRVIAAAAITSALYSGGVGGEISDKFCQIKLRSSAAPSLNLAFFNAASYRQESWFAGTRTERQFHGHLYFRARGTASGKTKKKSNPGTSSKPSFDLPGQSGPPAECSAPRYLLLIR